MKTRLEYRVLYETSTGSIRELMVTEDARQAIECRNSFRELGKTVTLQQRRVTDWEKAAR